MRRSLLPLLLVVGVLFVTAETGYAQPKKGDKEVLVFANVTSVLGTDNTNVSGNLFLNAGFFINDTLEIGGGPTLTITAQQTPGSYNPYTGQTEGGGTDISADAGVNFFARKAIRTANPKIQPYFGGEFFIQSLKNAGDSTFGNGIFGVKDYLTERMSLDAKFSVGVLLNDPGSMQLIQFTAGFTYLF